MPPTISSPPTQLLATEPSPARAEFEFLLRVLLADAASSDELRASLDTTRQRTTQLYGEGLELLTAYRERGVVFPERMHLNMLWAVFVRDLLRLIIDWCNFAEREIGEVGSPAELGESTRAHELLDALIDGRSVIPPRTTPPSEPA